MSKNVYQTYDQDALKHFELEGAPLYGVPISDGGHTFEKVLLTDYAKKYKEIKTILSTASITTFGSEKKAFLLPRSPVSIQRVKSALKEHGIILTNDFTNADLIITHDAFHSSFRDGETIQTTKMMAEMWNYETIATSVRSSSVSAFCNTHNISMIYDSKFNFNLWSEEYDTLMETWLITGLALNLAYHIDTSSIEVINVENCLHQSANKQVIDKQLIQDIINQCNSGNEENIAIAGKILPTIDYSQFPHLMWEFAQEFWQYNYYFKRNKDVQYWLENASISSLYHKSAEDMILYLEENGSLDITSFRYLEPIVRKEIRIDNRNLYVFKVAVKPEYRKFLKNKKEKK